MNAHSFAVALRSAVLLVMLGICAALAGCASSGATVYPVRGEVFHNAKPAEGALVHFHPRDKEKCQPAYATVQSDGSFQLTTFSPGDGAAVGDYVVTVNWREEKQVDGETIVGRDRLKDRYSKRDKSDLKAAVTVGDNVVPRFNLK